MNRVKRSDIVEEKYYIGLPDIAKRMGVSVTTLNRWKKEEKLLPIYLRCLQGHRGLMVWHMAESAYVYWTWQRCLAHHGQRADGRTREASGST